MERNIEIANECLEGLKSKEVSVWIEDEENYMNFILFSSANLEKEQYGYSKLESGDSLIGHNRGDWKEGWIVIGYNEDLDDPLFLDVKSEKIAVYTAEHGTGTWEPILLSSSWEEFKKEIC